MNPHKEIVLTGDRPTGRLHLGHYVGSIKKRIELQDKYKQFVMVADVQALAANAGEPGRVRSNVLEVTLDNIAASLDPTKTTFFIQSMIPEIAELTVYFMNLVSLARLERNPTIKDEMKQKGYARNVPLGFLSYPVSQTADILAFKATLVPVGEDQLPVLEQVNEIVQKFNSYYGKDGDVFSKVKPIVSEDSRLPGIDGRNKMSKSLDNCIFLSDSDDEIKRKVMLAYTDPSHIRVTDPGKIEGNVVFSYLRAFDKDKDAVRQLEEKYKNGGLGDVEVKKRLIEVLQEFIGPIRERREYLAKEPGEIMDILKRGTEEAHRVAKDTLLEVKAAIELNYF